MNTIEVSAKNVDDAITKALIELGTTSDNVNIEIVDKGSNGLFGIGSRKAVIRATRKTQEDDILTEVKTPVAPAAKPEKKVEKKPEVKSAQKEVKAEVKKEVAVTGETPEAFLKKIFDAMGMEVEIQVSEIDEENTMSINLVGEDMGILIGKRGQTLDSLQYLVSLVVNKNQEEYIRVKLDTENYRERRKETLETLAKNIAYRVKRTKQSISLEPMNPYERRIIHSALQNDKYVVTKSEGEEPFRHVVISLKYEKNYRSNNRYRNNNNSNKNKQPQE